MKSTAQGVLLENGTLTMEEAMGYVLSLPGVSTLIIGCKTPAEVDENARFARQFAAFTAEQLQELEGRTRPNADEFSYFKRPASIFSGDDHWAAHRIAATQATESWPVSTDYS